eukprot:6492680-Amphidinium_carterae.2
MAATSALQLSQRRDFLSRVFTLLQMRRQAYLEHVTATASACAQSFAYPCKKKGQRSTATEIHAKRTAAVAAPASTSVRAHVWIPEAAMSNAHRWVCTTRQRHAYNRDRIKLDLMGCTGAPQKKGDA